MIAIEKAGEDDTQAICTLDRMVLGRSERQDYIESAVRAGECLVARDEGTLVGFAVVNQSFYGNGFIGLLFVHPDHRRRGVGTALVRRIESMCPTEKLFTSTNASNTPMQRLCCSLGFAVSGHIDNLDEGDPEVVFFKRVGGTVGEGVRTSTTSRRRQS